MKKIKLELTERELHSMAEMMAFILTLQSIVKPEQNNAQEKGWRKLAAAVLEKAVKELPALKGDLLPNAEFGHWFFTEKYLETAYFNRLLDEVRDSVFWSELVQRMADHTLSQSIPPEQFDKLTDAERRLRVSSLEQALWEEVTHHGIDRLIFMLSGNDC